MATLDSAKTGALPDDGDVTYRRAGRIAFIELDRPAKLNALSESMALRLRDALQRFDLDDEADIGILCGAGKAFCAGADVGKHKRGTLERQAASLNDVRRDLFYNTIHWKPIIAAVHGYVYGFGLSLVLRCDLIVAAEDARMKVAEIPRGLSGGGLWAALAFQGHGAFADKAVLTGREFTAQEAREAGLITQMTPAGEHVREAQRIAEEMLELPQLALRDTVRTRRWYMQDHLRNARYFSQPHPNLHESADFKSRTHSTKISGNTK